MENGNPVGGLKMVATRKGREVGPMGTRHVVGGGDSVESLFWSDHAGVDGQRNP